MNKGRVVKEVNGCQLVVGVDIQDVTRGGKKVLKLGRIAILRPGVEGYMYFDNTEKGMKSAWFWFDTFTKGG